MVFGALNAFMVVILGMNSFIATLGVQTALTGITYGITNSTVVVGVPSGIIKFATTSFLGLQLQVWIAWILAAAVWWVYEYTSFGRYLLFIGGNQRAASLAGVRTSFVRCSAYVTSGAVYGLAGVVLLGSTGSADPSVGLQYLLPPLAAAFLGTTAIQLGRFNIVGTILGAYLLLTISTGLELLGTPSWVAQLFNGAALIIAVGFARISLGRENSLR
jgi:ribose transport system permease protein